LAYAAPVFNRIRAETNRAVAAGMMLVMTGSTPANPPPAPRGLGRAGAAFWRDSVRELVFSKSELLILHQTCLTVDELAEMKAEFRDMGTTVAGSSGQPVANPMFTSMAAHRALLGRLIKALHLPAEVSAAGRRKPKLGPRGLVVARSVVQGRRDGQ
jgi:hypothetical protein